MMYFFRHVELVEQSLPAGRRRDRRDALSELKRIEGEQAERESEGALRRR
jgi:hypothetical protein